MKKQLLGLIALIVLLGSMVQTTKAKEFPGGGNPFQFHQGVPTSAVHSPINGVCSGLSQWAYDYFSSRGQIVFCSYE